MASRQIWDVTQETPARALQARPCADCRLRRGERPGRAARDGVGRSSARETAALRRLHAVRMLSRPSFLGRTWPSLRPAGAEAAERALVLTRPRIRHGSPRRPPKHTCLNSFERYRAGSNSRMTRGGARDDRGSRESGKE